MARYTTRRPRADYDDNVDWGFDQPLLPSLVVEVDDGAPTGLLDKDGNEFVKHPDPIGYVRF